MCFNVLITYTRLAWRRLPHSNLDSNIRLGQVPSFTTGGWWSLEVFSESYTICTPRHLEIYVVSWFSTVCWPSAVREKKKTRNIKMMKENFIPSVPYQLFYWTWYIMKVFPICCMMYGLKNPKQSSKRICCLLEAHGRESAVYLGSSIQQRSYDNFASAMLQQ